MRQYLYEVQKVLQNLLQNLDVDGGILRNTTAFVGEKFARIKLLIEDPSGGQLAQLEKLEALALGIEGKRALWHSLIAIAEEIPALTRADLARLDQRADDQHQRVESRRIKTAREAFVPENTKG